MTTPAKRRSKAKTTKQFDFDGRFPSEQKAREYLELLRWGDQHVCPYCWVQGRQADWKTRPGNYQCKDCRKVYSVRIGTVLEKSKLGYRKWLRAIYFLQAAAEEVSSLQLSREISVHQKTARHVLNRLKECCEVEGIRLFGMSKTKAKSAKSRNE